MAPTPESVRLVIWDLDETFWGGTLTEGGIAFRPDHAEIVTTLSRRGIVNSICSKNDRAPVEAILSQHDVLQHFVFSSISWEPKGPRLARLIEAAQLRPHSVMFIDDNPMNRAEAAHFVPGLQVEDETFIPRLLADPRFAGKNDTAMTRLAQYRVLDRRHRDIAEAGGNTADFLRASGITVSIEHRLDDHLDRVIELINRTNQLNFLKRRLPENQDEARAELTSLLSDHVVQGGLIRVRDNYGDYGYCGLYITRRTRRSPVPVLLQFAFSCRILGMGIETWMYNRLGRPPLQVAGEVLTDLANDLREIDWISLKVLGVAAAPEGRKPIAYVLGRGGCDMRALLHYFTMVAGEVVEEFADAKNGMTPLTSGSVLGVHALRGVPGGFIADCAALGFDEADFRSAIATPPGEGPAVWLLNFTIEQGITNLRHKASGLLVPAWLQGYRGGAKRMLRADPAQTGLDPALIAQLRTSFDDYGLVPDDDLRADLRLILGAAPPHVSVFVILANQKRSGLFGEIEPIVAMSARNDIIREVARDLPTVTLIDPLDHMSEAEVAALRSPHHYDRTVYFRMFQTIMRHMDERASAEAAPAPRPVLAAAAS